MNNISFELLKYLFSESRLSPYFLDHTSASELLDKYHTNIVLSEAMLPTLHYFEICLRNRINQLFCDKYGSNWLTCPPSELKISIENVKKIEKISTKISKRNIPIHNDILAQMTFGFWCSFFQRKYDTILWHHKDSYTTVFPNLPRKICKLSYIEPRILKIKDLRNRIAHHEPIWNKISLIIPAYNYCIELLSAISYDAPRLLKSIDRFPDVSNKLLSIKITDYGNRY